MRDISVTLGLKDLEAMIETAYLRGVDARYDMSVPEDYESSDIKKNFDKLFINKDTVSDE